MPLLYAYYGDDFTGSTDVLEQLAEAGVKAVLFTRPPSPEDLAAHPGLAAFGVAGDSRSRPPAWMDEHLAPVFAAMRASDARVGHYKVCSTFDSAPGRGSIGRAMDIGARVYGGDMTPVVVGAPHLRRYVVFGQLFASAGQGGEVFRIDRHPTMSRHPATPMHEADLRRHLAQQTEAPVALVDLPTLREADLDARLGAAPGAVLFDGVEPADLGRAGALIWPRARRRPLFAVGSSGLTLALIQQWRAEGLIAGPPPPPAPAEVPALLAVSGSCSPVTEGQIRAALAAGYANLPAAPGLGPDDEDRIARAAVEALKTGRSAVIYSALGAPAGGAAQAGDDLGRALGRMLARIVRESGVRRALLAGGDTSSHAVGELGLDALSWRARLEPGAPLCAAHAGDPALDGLELVLKGGQMGSADFFEVVRRGAPSR